MNALAAPPGTWRSTATCAARLDRREQHASVGNQPSTLQQLTLGAARNGQLAAIDLVAHRTSGIATSAGVSWEPRLVTSAAARQLHGDVDLDPFGRMPAMRQDPPACGSTSPSTHGKCKPRS